MSTSSLASPEPSLARALSDLLGPENVLADADSLTFYSTDVYRRADVDAVLVVRPGSIEDLQQAVRIATSHGAPVIPRGGGLSYTGGFLPIRPGSVIVDMLRLDKILEINAEDMYVTVECGASWRSLYEALEPLGLRTPYFGPMSGYHSTIGGALSQGSIFLGSTQYGTSAESVLSLEVVTADGGRVTTGSDGGVNGAGPFFRNYGPDLTGLFLNDAGALGFKARATLKLLHRPEESAFVSFTFASHGALLRTMSKVARRGLAAECFGADPFIWGMRLWDADLGRDVKRLAGVVKAGRTLTSGLKDAARMAIAGRKALGAVEYAMNVVVDGRCGADVDFALAEIRALAREEAGAEVEATVPRAIRAAPFLPPNDILGPKGERWAPSHGISPHSRVVAVTDALHGFFESRADLLERHHVEWGYVTFAVSTTAILLEPMLYWPGARELYHERMIAPAHLAKLPKQGADLETAAMMRRLREELSAFWLEQGCVHLQIGKTYRFLDSRTGPVRELLVGIKSAVDPRGLVNPGALGMV
jgi:FAD/FMN-containing dehydrogenase